MSDLVNREPMVFVVQEVFRRDKELGEWEPAHNLKPAQKYGRFKILYRPEPGTRSDKDLDDMIDIIESGMKDFTEDDFFLPVGAPEAIIAAAAFAARNTDGYIQLLSWNSFRKRYDVKYLNLWGDDETRSEDVSDITATIDHKKVE